MTSGISTTWKNSDGLIVRFGTTEGTASVGGTYEDSVGGLQVLEFNGLDLTTLGTSSSGIGSLAGPGNGTGSGLFIPSTAVIEKVEIFVVKAATVGTSLSMGLIKSDVTTQVDATGILNAETQSHLGTLGRRWIYTVSGGFLDGAPATTSAQQGTSLGSIPGGAGSGVDCYVTAYTVGTFSAGVIDVRIFLSYNARDAILT